MTLSSRSPEIESGPIQIWERASLLLLCLLALILPFESMRGLSGVPGTTLTNVELVILVYLLGSWGSRIRRMRSRGNQRTGALAGPGSGRFFPSIREPAFLSFLLWIVALLLSALFVSDQMTVSLKFAARLLLGGSLFWSARGDLGRSAGFRTAVAELLLVGGATASLLGGLEFYNLADLTRLLAPFRTEIAAVSGGIRLSGPFDHANEAAGALALLLPLGLGLGIVQLAAGRTRTGLAALALVLVLCWSLLLTLSRSGIIAGMGTLLLVGLLIALRIPGRLGKSAIVYAVAAEILVLGFAAFTVPALSQRFFGAPTRPHAVAYAGVDSVATLAVGVASRMPITVTNTGDVTWRRQGPRPHHLSYHWTDARGEIVEFEGERTRFERDVRPGETVDIEAVVVAPEKPGDYVLLWDLVQEHVTWFSQAGSRSAKTFVQVVPEGSELELPARISDWARDVAVELVPWRNYQILPRRTLWSLAGEMFRRSPILGIGPDRYRATYFLDLPPGDYDPRIHCNSLYLELAATTGLLGLSAFLALLGALTWSLIRRIRTVPRLTPGRAEKPTGREGTVWAISGLGILAAFAAHGFLDCFLEPFAVMGTLWLGLAVAFAGSSAFKTEGRDL